MKLLAILPATVPKRELRLPLATTVLVFVSTTENGNLVWKCAWSRSIIKSASDSSFVITYPSSLKPLRSSKAASSDLRFMKPVFERTKTVRAEAKSSAGLFAVVAVFVTDSLCRFFAGTEAAEVVTLLKLSHPFDSTR